MSVETMVKRLEEEQQQASAFLKSEGTKAGRQWAEGAKLAELRCLERYSSDEANDCGDPEAVFHAIFPDERRNASEWWNEGRDRSEPADDPAFVEAFVEAAMQLWEEAKKASPLLR